MLRDGVTQPEVLADLDRRCCRVLGKHEQWRAYLARPDVQPMGEWLLGKDVKCQCAVTAVKKNGAQRKILAVCPKNARWGQRAGDGRTIMNSGDPPPDDGCGVSSGPLAVAVLSGMGISTGVSVDCVPHALR